MRTLSLDCDSFKIAAAVFDDLKLVEVITVTADKKLDSDKRAQQMYADFSKLLDSLKPDQMVTEKSLYSNNFISSRTITEVISYCKLACGQRSIPYFMVYVPSWKKYITGSGKSTKEEIRKYVLKIYPQLIDDTQDICDAAGIGAFFLEAVPPAPSRTLDTK